MRRSYWFSNQDTEIQTSYVLSPVRFLAAMWVYVLENHRNGACKKESIASVASWAVIGEGTCRPHVIWCEKWKNRELYKGRVEKDKYRKRKEDKITVKISEEVI